MNVPNRVMLVLALLLVFGAALPAGADPRDAQVGSTRATFNRAGTPLRSGASTLGAPVATLPYGTRVRVLEVKLPWLRVETLNMRGSQQTGWLRAFETAEASALSSSPSPPHLTTVGDAGVSEREKSAAGRQLDANTERGYRAQRADLATAYRLVDAMESETQRMDPGESIGFITYGRIGRSGRDYARPGRVPGGVARTAAPRRRASSGAVSGFLGRLAGEGARRLGAGSTGSRVAGSVVEAAVKARMDEVQQMRTAFSPQQEYFLGRAVAAKAIARYGVDPDPERRRYVRLIGDAVVRLSARVPGNFGGYHFEVLDSDEINGVSGPGGFVLITRGAVNAAQTEAELAGVLAHELAHVIGKHGELLIRKTKKFGNSLNVLGTIAGAAAGAAGAPAWAQGMVQFFGESVEQMSTTAIDHDYGKALEHAADRDGTYLLQEVYYNHAGLRDLLGRLPAGPQHFGRASTHAPPAVRVQALNYLLATMPAYVPWRDTEERRQERYDAMPGRATAVPR